MPSFAECGRECISGQFIVYGQWFGIFSGFMLVLLGFVSAISFVFLSPLMIWVILGWVFAVIIFLVEMPWCLKCCPFNEKCINFIHVLEPPQYRCGIYLVMATLQWLAFAVANPPPVAMVFNCLFLTITGFLFVIALLKGEIRKQSTATAGNDVMNCSLESIEVDLIQA